MSSPTASPPLNFSTFIISLASSALAHLGHVDETAHNITPVDPRLARDTMDLIDMLKEKTKGNLDEEEQRLLDAVQQELRTRYGATAS